MLDRRQFFGDCGFALGSIALSTLLADEGLLGAERRADTATDPLNARPGHHPAKAKRVIQLFMAGGPSQLDLFDEKPQLRKLSGQQVPTSYVEGKRFAFLKPDAKLQGSQRKFQRYGESGANISELLPHTAAIADRLTIVRSMKTDVFNHGPAKLMLNCGSPRFGHPSMGSWVQYGIGSESRELPGYVVLLSGPRGPRGGAGLYGNGFLPSEYQGVLLRGSGDPILNIASPQGVSAQEQQRTIETINALNSARREQTGDADIDARVAAYEMAYRMQTSAPELIDLSDESAETFAHYGAEPGQASFAYNCILARRLAERGVRFITLFHTDWDHHGNGGLDLAGGIELTCKQTDQAAAALVTDLAQRGLLDDTIVIWGGEFGRTPMGEVRHTNPGRDHHIDSYTMWMAGGGFQPGVNYGESDELGFYCAEPSRQVHVHDLQATVLHLLGLDHLKLTYRFQGRNFRLTDVGGNVMQPLLA